MPRTADWRDLNNPFDVIAALKASASYLRDLRSVLAISVLRLPPTTPARFIEYKDDGYLCEGFAV